MAAGTPRFVSPCRRCSVGSDSGSLAHFIEGGTKSVSKHSLDTKRAIQLLCCFECLTHYLATKAVSLLHSTHTTVLRTSVISKKSGLWGFGKATRYPNDGVAEHDARSWRSTEQKESSAHRPIGSRKPAHQLANSRGQSARNQLRENNLPEQRNQRSVCRQSASVKMSQAPGSLPGATEPNKRGFLQKHATDHRSDLRQPLPGCLEPARRSRPPASRTSAFHLLAQRKPTSSSERGCTLL